MFHGEALTMREKAIILLSGGLDSATCCAVALNEGYEVYAITFSYGQKHSVEVEKSEVVARYFSLAHHYILEIQAAVFSESALSRLSDKQVPKDRDVDNQEDIPETYVPARNILFLSYALAFCEKIGARTIFIGINAVDYSGYPDCRPEFIENFRKMADVGTKVGLERGFDIRTPLINLSKADIIKLGMSLGVDYSITHSCYDPDEKGNPCGKCDSCKIRKKGFIDAGVPDPTIYRR